MQVIFLHAVFQSCWTGPFNMAAALSCSLTHAQTQETALEESHNVLLVIFINVFLTVLFFNNKMFWFLFLHNVSCISCLLHKDLIYSHNKVVCGRVGRRGEANSTCFPGLSDGFHLMLHISTGPKTTVSTVKAPTAMPVELELRRNSEDQTEGAQSQRTVCKPVQFVVLSVNHVETPTAATSENKQTVNYFQLLEKIYNEYKEINENKSIKAATPPKTKIKSLPGWGLGWGV